LPSETPIAASPQTISKVERSRRQAEVNFARGNVRYEGGTLSDEVENLNARYIAGEIGSEDLTAAILACTP